METIIALFIVVAAAVLVCRRFYRQAKRGSACDCGCSSCELAVDCEDSRTSFDLSQESQ